MGNWSFEILLLYNSVILSSRGSLYLNPKVGDYWTKVFEFLYRSLNLQRIHDGLAQTSWPRQSGPRCDILARPKRQFGPMIRPFGPKNRRFGPNIFCITNPAIDGTQSWLEGCSLTPSFVRYNGFL